MAEIRKPQLFEYAVVWHPTEQQTKDGQKSKVIVEPKVVLAMDNNGAAIIAARAIGSEYIDQLDQVEVAIRPF